jgi:chromosome segregation ATPase
MGHRARAGLIAASIVLLLVSVGVARRAWLDTRDATDRTVADLHDTRAELAQARDDLATANAEYDATVAKLSEELGALGVRRDESEVAQQSLDDVELVLAELEAQLAVAEADLGNRTSRLDAFERCLVGVVEVLNQAAVSDTDGLAATLRRIGGTCAEAGVTL